MTDQQMLFIIVLFSHAYTSVRFPDDSFVVSTLRFVITMGLWSLAYFFLWKL